MGGDGSGRSSEKPLSAAKAKKLFEGLSLDTAEGNRELIRRAMEMMVQGKIPKRYFDSLVKGCSACRGLIVDAEVDRRVDRVIQAKEEIKAARAGGRALRDVGPPPDSLAAAEGAADGTATQDH